MQRKPWKSLKTVDNLGKIKVGESEEIPEKSLENRGKPWKG